MKKSILILACVALSACVTGYNPRYYFNEVQVVNLAGATIADVSVRIIESPKSLACEEVRKNAMCRDYFGKRPYPQQGVELNWTHADGSAKTETVNPSVPVTFSSAFPLRIVVEIREDGTVKPFFEQEEPSRDGGAIILGRL